MSFRNNKVLTEDSYGDVSYISLIDLDQDEHKVFDIKGNCFVPFWIKQTPKKTDRQIKIFAGSLGTNLPFEDIYLLTGYSIKYKNEIVKSVKLPVHLRKRMKTKPENVYAICTENGCWIDIAGVPVLSWKLSNIEDL